MPRQSCHTRRLPPFESFHQAVVAEQLAGDIARLGDSVSIKEDYIFWR